MTAEITEEPVPAVQESDGAPSEDAPYGYMTDPETGERRPKKRPGRRSKAAKLPSGTTPPVEELQALGSLPGAAEDTAPGTPPKGRRRGGPKSVEALPPFRAGVIAKGMNSLYRRAGRMLRLWDRDLGTAVIACTRAEDEDDTTVGEAWENLAKANPRVRAFLLKALQTGAWSGLFMAHAPIFLAIAMKPGIRERLPFWGMADALLLDEDEAGGPEVPSGLAQMMGGIGPEDMAQMMAMAQGLMGQMAGRAPNMPREPVASHPEVSEPQYHGMREHPAGQE